MGRAAKDKGKRGEQELARKIREQLGIQVSRNWQAQAHAGGADIYLPPCAIEIKRQEQLQLQAWWRQACRQVTDDCPIPVLAFRQSRRQWRFLLPAKYLLKRRFLKAQVGEQAPPPPYAVIEVGEVLFYNILSVLVSG